MISSKRPSTRVAYKSKNPLCPTLITCPFSTNLSNSLKEITSHHMYSWAPRASSTWIRLFVPVLGLFLFLLCLPVSLPACPTMFRPLCSPWCLYLFALYFVFSGRLVSRRMWFTVFFYSLFFAHFVWSASIVFVSICVIYYRALPSSLPTFTPLTLRV